MQTITLNDVTIHDVPTENGLLSIQTTEVLTRLTALAGLYGLAEVSFTNDFLTTPQVIEGDCPHCQGAKEVSIQQRAQNEAVLVACVCSADFVAPMSTDIGNGAQEPAVHNTEGGQPQIMAQIVAPNAEFATGVDDSVLHTATNNIVALFKGIGHNFAPVADTSAKLYQFIVVGEPEPTLTERLCAQFGDAQMVYALETDFVIHADAEFEVPRILTQTEISIKRNLFDLRIAATVPTVLESLQGNLATYRSIESTDISAAPSNYNISYSKFTALIRTIVSISKLQNCQYNAINQEAGTRIANAYLLDELTGVTYLATLYFMNGEVVPSNYSLCVEQPSEGERSMTVNNFISEVTNLIENLESAQNA